MSQYYGESQWPNGPAHNQPSWDHQTPPPPSRSGASSVNPREDAGAFTHQLEEVDRAIDNLVKSGKMFGGSGRREFDLVLACESLRYKRYPLHKSDGSGHDSSQLTPLTDSRGASAHGGPRSHSDFGGDARGPPGQHGPNLQNFYASQRQQSSRGSNEAEQMMQAKRRMAAQRERELRNYHQEQQYNRSNSLELPNKTERAHSPGNMSEDDRRDLIARQRSALYGEGAFVDEHGTSRPAGPGLSSGPSSHRGPSPLAYDYTQGNASASADSGSHRHTRAASNASPQSTTLGAFDGASGQQASRTTNSSPTGGSPPHHGGPPGKANQSSNTVAPIGTRPSGGSQASNPALGKRSTTPLPSPLSQGYSAGDVESKDGAKVGAPKSQSGAGADGYNGWGNRSGWGNKSNLGVQASVWG
ncbi:hypothetical protein MN608_02765 [Microdochium nivale]|nr:hypothetical protein MN608_02765 [Microdochium nivale]